MNVTATAAVFGMIIGTGILIHDDSSDADDCDDDGASHLG